MTAGGPAYEVMYLLRRQRRRRASRRCATAWTSSATRCSSSGGPDLWNVHVHVDDVGAAIEAGIEAGRPHRIRVTHFAEQVGRAGPSRSRRWRWWPAPPGQGLADVFRAAGAVVVHQRARAARVGRAAPRRRSAPCTPSR